jgi:hypothetical protein
MPSHRLVVLILNLILGELSCTAVAAIVMVCCKPSATSRTLMRLVTDLDIL